MENLFIFMMFTAFSCCSAFSPFIIRWVLSLFASRTSEEINAIAELKDIRSQLAGLSMVDEFAKYARLQRRANKLQECITASANISIANVLKRKVMATYITHLIMGIILLYMIWMYRKEPVFMLPEGWLYPIDGLLSWPTGQTGAVSASVWLVISGTSLRMLAAALY